jgi:hypothetical protein
LSVSLVFGFWFLLSSVCYAAHVMEEGFKVMLNGSCFLGILELDSYVDLVLFVLCISYITMTCYTATSDKESSPFVLFL